MCHYTVICVIIYKYVSSTLKDNGEQFGEPTEEIKEVGVIGSPQMEFRRNDKTRKRSVEDK